MYEHFAASRPVYALDLPGFGDRVDEGYVDVATMIGWLAAEVAARVAAIREALDDAGVEGAIRIDTNQRWTLQQAIERLAVLDAVSDCFDTFCFLLYLLELRVRYAHRLHFVLG